MAVSVVIAIEFKSMIEALTYLLTTSCNHGGSSIHAVM